jgi:Flp pilus assembly protein TadG
MSGGGLHRAGLARGYRPQGRMAGLGQSMVEFAIVAPVIFFLLFGIVDFGRAIFYANEVTNGARDGARMAILQTNPCNTVVAGTLSGPGSCTSGGAGTSVCAAIEQDASLVGTWSCSESGVIPTTGTAMASEGYVEVDQSSSAFSCPSVPTPTSSDGQVLTPRQGGNLPIRVTVEYYYRPLTPILGSFFPSTFYISSTVCVRPEY